MTDLPRLRERLAAGCDCSVTCQALHADALAVIEWEASAVLARISDLLACSIGGGVHFAVEPEYSKVEVTFRKRDEAGMLSNILTDLHPVDENGCFIHDRAPDDEAAILAEAKAIATSDWKGEITVADVWPRLYPSEQQQYLANARAARAARP